MDSSLSLYKTIRFSVLGLHDDIAPLVDATILSIIPVLNLIDLLSCAQRGTLAEAETKQILWQALELHGFIVLLCRKSSEPGKIIHDLRKCIDEDFFPVAKQDQISSPRNLAQLQSGSVYVNEKDVPMYKLGYELCDDIREVYRVHAGSPDSQPWPLRSTNCVENFDSSSPRSTWLRGMALCRHICDEALRLTLGYGLNRPGSGASSWKKPKRTVQTAYYQQESLEDRIGDKSVIYAMHYFNDHKSITARLSGRVTGTDDVRINVKEHTDPSLFVLEPFLADMEGFQVHPRPQPCFISPSQELGDQEKHNMDHPWIACDGKSSPIHSLEDEGNMAMILFVGRAFSLKAKEIAGRSVIPTLHRVVGPSTVTIPAQSRRTVIYEQKYEEYFPD